MSPKTFYATAPLRQAWTSRGPLPLALPDICQHKNLVSGEEGFIFLPEKYLLFQKIHARDL